MKRPPRRPRIPAPSSADVGDALVDLDRAARCGAPEVVFGQGKTPAQITRIALALKAAGQAVLVTRTTPQVHRRLSRQLPGARWHELARTIAWHPPGAKSSLPGSVAVVCAGTADLPVAEEAAVCLEFWGASVTRIRDVGVAGLHRLLSRTPDLRRADIVIVAAGMEGALPSIVGGLLDRPVIAVPTSVGYGANLQGLSALLGMLTSCASGLTVVNIDNGFGAAYAALRILRLLPHAR